MSASIDQEQLKKIIAAFKAKREAQRLVGRITINEGSRRRNPHRGFWHQRHAGSVARLGFQRKRRKFRIAASSHQ